ncbi:MAG: enoyl-CoA hydratase/isomerase family protein [Dehalococcoidales bacterium]|nr:enoyl-CoA hydratase/isomerase family protein [Dehalococcoidales bacterium]
MTDPVIYKKKNNIGYISLNCPESGNKIDMPLAQELAGVCQQINLDGEVYLAVLCGSADVFSLGGDSAILPLVSPAGIIAGLKCPVIAAVNGDALGMGLELALACDIRYASDSASFGLPQVTEGCIPMDGGTQRLPRIVGRGKAMEMLLTGCVIDSGTALSIGLVNQVVKRQDFSAWIESTAGNIAVKAPLAMRYVKEAVHSGLDLSMEQGLRLEADLYFLLHTTEDRTEGIRSFLEKRSPQYKAK